MESQKLPSHPAVLLKSIALMAIETQMPDLLVKQKIRQQGESLIICNQSFDLHSFNKIHVLGAGKGVFLMYRGLRKILGSRISGGVAVSPADQGGGDDKILWCRGSHPIPDRLSLQAGESVHQYVKSSVGADDLVLFLLTGGASAMMVLPVPALSLSDVIMINELLLKSGADIREVNCVRKHISVLKGGRLAEIIHPAAIITLIISDIVGSPTEDIGSGPTIGDSSTFEQLFQILNKYDLHSRLSPALKQFFQAGREKRVAETPEPGQPGFARDKTFILGDIGSLIEGVRAIAREQGLCVQIITDSDQGGVGEAAKYYARKLKEHTDPTLDPTRPLLLLAGGEVTVKVRGRGKGGRNQQFILHLLQELADFNHPFCAMSLGSDGIDGPTDAAGAWIDHYTYGKVKKMSLSVEDYLANNDAYHFFSQLDQLVKTGPTGTNVMDLRMFYLPAIHK